MALTAMWTHGNAVIPETPHLLHECTRFGFGTQTKLHRGTKQWFHVAMPTPVILQGVRPRLKRVFILGRSDVSSCITRVHIFDNNNRVEDRGVLICGDKLQIKPDNTIELNHPIFLGLGISMFIDSSTFEASFFFAGFGADWE
ncbi:DUF6623 family protein [Nonomuraea sp. NPDC050404]|uniref:DUF6623 family protein n=1 Tax=Nonomuraea sp. NPDC050404 TaxID=3155783 RepID=UPI0033DADE3A